MRNKLYSNWLIGLIPRALICLGFVILGVFLGHFSGRFGQLDLEPRVSLDQVFNFVIGVLVAVLLGSIWQKYYGTSRAEKDLILGRIAELRTDLSCCYELFNAILADESNDTQDRARPDVRGSFNQLVMKLESAKRKLVYIGAHLEKTSIISSDARRELDLELILIKNALTLKDCYERYDSSDVKRANLHFDTLNEKLFDVSIDINSK